MYAAYICKMQILTNNQDMLNPIYIKLKAKCLLALWHTDVQADVRRENLLPDALLASIKYNWNEHCECDMKHIHTILEMILDTLTGSAIALAILSLKPLRRHHMQMSSIPVSNWKVNGASINFVKTCLT